MKWPTLNITTSYQPYFSTILAQAFSAHSADICIRTASRHANNELTAMATQSFVYLVFVFSVCVRGSAGATLTLYDGCTACDASLAGCNAQTHTIADDADFGSTLRQDTCATSQTGDDWYMSCEAVVG